MGLLAPLLVILVSLGLVFLTAFMPMPGESCAPKFVDPGTSVGMIDGQRHRILEIDKRRCWVEVEPEPGGATQWVDGSVIRYAAEPE